MMQIFASILLYYVHCFTSMNSHSPQFETHHISDSQLSLAQIIQPGKDYPFENPISPITHQVQIPCLARNSPYPLPSRSNGLSSDALPQLETRKSPCFSDRQPPECEKGRGHPCDDVGRAGSGTGAVGRRGAQPSIAKVRSYRNITSLSCTEKQEPENTSE